MAAKTAMAEKILITGASGQLGYELTRRLGERATNKPHEAMDVTDIWKMREWLPVLRPDMIVHCAAYTDMVKAEREKDKCWAVNALATHALAVVAKRIGCPFLFISTNMVFGAYNGVYGAPTPFTERYPVGPTSVYGNSKAAAEHAILQANPDNKGYWIIRTAGLYERPWRQYRNFPQNLIQMSVRHAPLSLPNDTIVSSTYVPHLADAIMLVIENRDSFPCGTYHVANTGECSLHELGREFSGVLPKPANLKITDHAEYFNRKSINPGVMPQYSALSTKKYEDISPIRLPSWKEAVEEYGHQLKKFA